MNQERITEKEVTRYWDENADSWSEQVRKGRDVCRDLINNPTFFRLTGDVIGKAVLDAGCGDGYNTRILARKGARVVGVDISPRMIELAREAEEKEPLGIRYEVASFTDLSIFDDASFDMVASFMAVMDGPDYQGALREFRRVLRRKGKLVFSITHPCFMTRGFGWIEDEKGEAIKVTASDYFNDEPWVERWGFSHGPAPNDAEPFAVPVFSRTLSDYINTLIKLGFVLKRIEEPRPSRQLCKRDPRFQRWRDHAANFLQLYAVKP